MENSTALQPGTVALEPPSTVLNPQTIGEHVSGAGRPALSEKDDGGSIESVLEAELADMRSKAKDDAPEPKAKGEEGADKDKGDKPDEKAAQPRENGKFVKTEKGDAEPEPAKDDKGAPAKAATGQEASERRTSEGRHPEPPARFLPDARAKWANVPNEVKAEFRRVSQEMEQENQGFRASHERYTQLKEFDDLAKSNGRDLRDSLTKVRAVEDAIARNPIEGLDAVLREIGPRKADGSPLTIMDVAHYLTQNPQAYQPRVEQPQMSQPAAQPQEHPEIKRLTEQVNQLVANQTILPVVEKFSEGKADFEGLADSMKLILSEGFVERLHGTGLSMEQRLSEAYRMAGGQFPSSRSDAGPAPAHSDATPSRPVKPDAGTKSVRGAPSDGFDTIAEDDAETDISALLRKEMRKLRA